MPGLLGIALPVLAAPMAGGPSTPELVVAAAEAGGLGFLAGGYKTADALAAQTAAVRAAGVPYAVNLFVPNPLPVEPAAYDTYRELLRPLAARLGAELPPVPREDDDGWRAKVDLLLADPPAAVSFTFGIPSSDVLAALRRAGTVLVQTVTSADEARQAAEAGVDALALQASVAGGHSGTFTPATGRVAPPAAVLAELLRAVAAVTGLPLLAAGGVMTAADAAAAVAAGAGAVVAGTALLLAPEAGTSAPHRAALAQDRGDTVVTRAFTGRPARALPNAFTQAYSGEAPAGYPALHHLTSPLRRAAAAAGDAENVNLWAGAGYRSVVARPAADTLRELSAKL